MRDLKGKVAVITGAAGAVGRGLANQLGDAGMNIVLADIDAAALEQAEEELRGKAISPLTIPTDTTKPEQLQALAEQVMKSFGGVHVLCANAGVIGRFTYIWEQRPEDWQWEIGVNVFGTANTVRAFAPIMIKQSEESDIVVTASEAGYTTRPFVGIYHSSKHALVAFTETLALEMQLINAPVRVHLLCPLAIQSPRLLAADRQRLRPAELRTEDATPNPSGEQLWESYRTGQNKQSGDEVAAAVLEGIHSGSFYIYPDPRLRDVVKGVYERITAEEYPTLAPDFVERFGFRPTAS